MPKLVPITPKKLIKILLQLGFTERDAEGSHILNDIQLSVEDYDKLR